MYVGVTNNLENRIAEHSDERGGAFTRKYRLNTLVYAEEYQYVDEAIAREKEIKGWRRSKKDALVEASNPTWADLLDPGIVKGPSLRSG
jgi:putative endonuclease